MKKFISIFLSAIILISSISLAQISVFAAETDNDEPTGASFKDDFIIALMNKQNLWNNSKYEYFYFCDIDWDGNPELICDYPKNSTGYSMAEMYGFDGRNIFKYTIDNTGKTEFLDKKLLYYNIKERNFVWLCVNVNTGADFCYQVPSSHYTQYSHWYNYELTTYDKKIFFDYYSGYCQRDGYFYFDRKADVEKGYEAGMYRYNVFPKQSKQWYDTKNSEHSKYLYGQEAVYSKYYFKNWSAKSKENKKQDLINGFNSFINSNKLKNQNAINAVQADSVKPSWKSHYINTVDNLAKKTNISNFMFWLMDFDNNGTPEMLINTSYGGWGMFGQDLISYFNKSTYDTEIGGYWSVYRYKNYLYVEGYRRPLNAPWEYYHIVTSIDNGKPTRVFTGRAISNSIYDTFYPENPKNAKYEYSIYSGTNKTVSSYLLLLNKLKEYVDTGNLTRLDSKNAYTSTQIKSAIENYGSKPAAPTISVANGVSGLDVAWGKVANAKSYIVYYKTASTGWSSVSTTATRVSLPKVQSGKYYYVQVQSIGSNGVKGNYSKVKTMTYLSRVNINSLVYNGNNTLKWYAVPGANKYQIARLKSGDKTYTYFYTTSPTLTEKNVVGGIAYTYQVRAMYQTSNSGTAYGAWSSTKSVPTLVAPTVTLSNKSNGIRVTWNSIRGAVRYIVYYKKSTDKNWSSAVTTNLYYPILNVQRGALYYVQVRPVGATVSQPYSSVKSIVFR